MRKMSPPPKTRKKMNSMILKNKREIRVVVIGVESEHSGAIGKGEVFSGELDEGFGEVLGGEGGGFDSGVFCIVGGGLVN